MSYSPQVMVSSTFYDLRQIRADLNEFLGKDLAYRPLLSELPSFPVNPDLDTVENCKARVRENADILVLVIGGRYGSMDQRTDKSITNLEFLAARQKGIPIYAFVEQKVLAIMPIWRQNKDAAFTSVVDTPRIFEFIELVRTQEKVWTFEFSTAQDIVSTLRLQFAHLFLDGLKARARLIGGGLPGYLDDIRPAALKIALEKPSGWEYLLFFQAWADEVEKARHLLKEHHSGLRLGPSEHVTVGGAIGWLSARFYELEGIAEAARVLVNESAVKAYGEPGSPGDTEELVWVAKKLGEVLVSSIAWAKRVRCARVAEPFIGVKRELARMADPLIEEFERFPKDAFKSVEGAILNASESNPQRLHLTIVLQLSDENAFLNELEHARQMLASGDWDE